ncbi:hypothetical protein LJB42_003757 [Komagataella kurtzmanii]|nr:hypothetical protein LJB42_003757 [Komagataella kurtzmanii]
MKNFSYTSQPGTPLDYNYGRSMLPSHLLTPFLATPVLPSQPSTPYIDQHMSNLDQKYLTEHYQLLHEVNHSRSLLFEKLPKELSLKEFLDAFKSSQFLENVKIKEDSGEGTSVLVQFVNDESALVFLQNFDWRDFVSSTGFDNLKISWCFNNSSDDYLVDGTYMDRILNLNATRSLAVRTLTQNKTGDQLYDLVISILKADLPEAVPLIVDYQYRYETIQINFSNISTSIEVFELLNDTHHKLSLLSSFCSDPCLLHHQMTTPQISSNAPPINSSYSNLQNRTIYLGGLHPDTTVESVCNVVKGGILQNVKLIPEKRICFVTFIDAFAAEQFYMNSQLRGLTIKQKRVRVGWGRPIGPVPNNIPLAVTAGASRNIYISESKTKKTQSLPSADILRHDFEYFGELEQINFFNGDKCVFLNFCNIAAAIELIDCLNLFKNKNLDPENPAFSLLSKYEEFKINFAKDRCGNLPKEIKRDRKPHHRSKDGKEPHEPKNHHNSQSDPPKASESASPEQIQDVQEIFASMGISTNGRPATAPISAQQKTDEEKSQSPPSGLSSISPTSSSTSKPTTASGGAVNFKDQQRPGRTYAMSGSQIMAQYLASVQHNNIYYANAVLNVESERNSEDDYN